jgi:single-stranded DNA-binding protein
MNKVFINGRLIKDPDLKPLENTRALHFFYRKMMSGP